jgi:hypothetical protein
MGRSGCEKRVRLQSSCASYRISWKWHLVGISPTQGGWKSQACRSVRSGVCHFVHRNTTAQHPHHSWSHTMAAAATQHHPGTARRGHGGVNPGAWHPNIPWSPAPAPTPSRSVGRDILARSLKQSGFLGDRQRFETCKVEQAGLCLVIPISRLPAVDPAFAQKLWQARRSGQIGFCGSCMQTGIQTQPPDVV